MKQPFSHRFGFQWVGFLRTLLSVVSLSVAGLGIVFGEGSVHADPTRDDPFDGESIQCLVTDLLDMLPREKREKLLPNPIRIVNDSTVRVTLNSVWESSVPRGEVILSTGFIRLINELAYAMVLNERAKGTFSRSILDLDSVGAAWDRGRFEDVHFMNAHLTRCNEIAGEVLAIHLSHLYLGIYEKHRVALASERRRTPHLHHVITPDDWETVVRPAIYHALSMASGPKTLRELLRSMDRADARPEWSVFFLPDWVDAKRLSRRLRRIEGDFFAGK